MERRCAECVYWKKDWGIWCVNGWSGAGRNNGHCHVEPKPVPTRADDLCRHFEAKSK